MKIYIDDRKIEGRARHDAPSLSSREEPIARLRQAGTSEAEAIYRLRYEAYLRDGMIGPRSTGRVADEFDEMPNAILLGVHCGDALASSIRLSIATSAFPDCPAARAFPDVVWRWLEAGRVIVDPTRFVLDPAQARACPKLAYTTMRLAWLACAHFGADLLLATPRTGAQGFYSRVFGHRLVAGPRPYPALDKPLGLMMLDYHEAKERVLARFPFFASTRQERERLFDGSPRLNPKRAITVQPIRGTRS